MPAYIRTRLTALLMMTLSLLGSSLVAAETETLESLGAALAGENFSGKVRLAGQIAALEDERALPLLKVFLAGDLYFNKANADLVELKREDGDYLARSLLSGETQVVESRRPYEKVSINNAVRRALRSLIAEGNLRAPDTRVRANAVREMMAGDDPETLPLLKRALEREENAGIRDDLEIAIALLNARFGEDSATQLAAISRLEGVLYPEARVVLTRLAGDADPETVEAGTVEAAALDALAAIETLVSLNKVAENLYFGISLGSVLLLAAVGLAITFGVMGVINMAHGEMIMLGAYTTFVIQQWLPNHIDISIFIAIPAAFLVSGAVGVAIERGVIRHLYGRPLETLLATFGISLILQQAVRSIFSPLNQSVATPEWMSGSLEINGVLALTYNRLYIIIFTMLVLGALVLLLKKTLFGLQMRAVTQNRRMASSMGIRTGWVDAMTFGLGSGIAGIAGVALSQLTNVGPNLGQAYIIDSFLVVVFGGVGNLLGTFFGAMSLGIANKFLEPFAGAVLAKIAVLVFIILFIQKYPRGMFALKGRSAED